MICHDINEVIPVNNNENIISQTPSSIYLMHKYWGKKPSKELREIIEKYTKENDLILDPFSGFGGMGVESILLNRNIEKIVIRLYNYCWLLPN